MSVQVHGGRVFEAARRLGVPATQIVDFSASINPLGLSERVAAAIREALPAIVHYPEEDAAGLRQALAAHHGISPDEIVAANGSTQLIHLLPRVATGRRALLVAPCFGEYEAALQRGGWRAEHVLLDPDDAFSLDLRRLRDALVRGADLLYLCNPGNPAGNLVPPAELEEIILFCREMGTLAVIDEAFVDFAPGASVLPFAVREKAIVLRSLTKFHAIPGLRLGYAAACSSLARRLAEGLEPWSVNTLSAAAGIACLDDGEHRDATLAYVTAERQRLAQRLAELGIRVFPSMANFLLGELPPETTAAALQERLLPFRILVRDCAGFAGLTRRHFRVAVRTREENDLLLRALAAALPLS